VAGGPRAAGLRLDLRDRDRRPPIAPRGRLGRDAGPSTARVPFNFFSLAAASKHIKALENAGLISREVRGRTHLCRLQPGPLASAHQWLSFYARFWTDRLEVLERLLRSEDPRASPTRKGDDQ
jgi:hypothetical protein